MGLLQAIEAAVSNANAIAPTARWGFEAQPTRTTNPHLAWGLFLGFVRDGFIMAFMTIRPATTDDADAITAIYNDAIAKTTAIFWHEPKPASLWRKRLTSRSAKHPALVAVNDSNTAIGFTTLGPYDTLCGYNDVAEWSLYIDAEARGRGVGRSLADAVIEAGRLAGLHSVVSRVTAGNDASIKLHARLGFRLVGTLDQVGRKFGERHDVLLYQRVLRACR